MAWLLQRWLQLQVLLVWVNHAVQVSPKQKRTSNALKNVQQLLKLLLNAG
nr:MAG TPA: hypothetical protein [Caudoviricetes sp.]